MAENGASQSGTAAGSDTGSQENSEDRTHAAVEAARAQVSRAAHSAADMSREGARHYVREPAGDLLSLLRDYAREKPDVTAVWCFGIGLIVGWKLKP